MAAFAYSYAHCAPYVGRMVICHTTSGVYRGTLHRVTRDGIYLARARAVAASGPKTEVTLEYADNPGAKHTDTEQVFFPFFFIPFATLFAFSVW